MMEKNYMRDAQKNKISLELSAHAFISSPFYQNKKCIEK
jgi:hypothetical protein